MSDDNHIVTTESLLGQPVAVSQSSTVCEDNMNYEDECTPLAVSLRSNLQLLQDFTYLCKETSALKTVGSYIEGAVQSANSSLKREGGLILQPTPEKLSKLCKDYVWYTAISSFL